MGKKYTVNVYGDSVLKGVLYDPEKGKYVPGHGTALNAIKDRFSLDIRNFSKFGATVDDIRRLIESDLNKGYGCDIIVLETGGNDCDYDWAKISADPDGRHLPKIGIYEYEEKLTSLINFIKERGITPIIATIPPIDAEKYLNHIVKNGLSRENIVRWMGGDPQLIARWQELYSSVNEAVARKTGCRVCDCRIPFLGKKNYGRLMCDDGIHPTKKGQTLIAASFYRFIMQNYPALAVQN